MAQDSVVEVGQNKAEVVKDKWAHAVLSSCDRKSMYGKNSKVWGRMFTIK